MSLAPRFFRWHRWVGYLAALQVLAWVVGGALFAWLPFKAWVKGEDAVGRPTLVLPADWAPRLAAAAPAGAWLEVRSVATAQGPAWRLRGRDGVRWLAAAGDELPAPTAADVERFARSLYRGSAPLAGVERLEEVPRRLGIVREAGHGAPLWRARFDDALGTRLYVDARSGELVAVRNEAWVLYDFFWRLHIMDYLEGEDFNGTLLRAAALAALALVATGLVLSTLALRRTWRRRRAGSGSSHGRSGRNGRDPTVG